MHVGIVDPVARRALGMAFADGYVGQSMETWQLGHVVATETARIGEHLPGMRLVTGQALPVAARAIGELFFVTACAGHLPRQLMHRALMAARTARMPHISTS